MREINLPKSPSSQSHILQGSQIQEGPCLGGAGSPARTISSLFQRLGRSARASWSPRSRFPHQRSRFWGTAGEEKPQSQAQKGPRGPEFHPPLPPCFPHHLPHLRHFPSPSQRASEEPGASDLSPAPIEKWVLVTTEITAFLALLPTARCKGSPKGGGLVSEGGCEKSGNRSKQPVGAHSFPKLPPAQLRHLGLRWG